MNQSSETGQSNQPAEIPAEGGRPSQITPPTNDTWSFEIAGHHYVALGPILRAKYGETAADKLDWFEKLLRPTSEFLATFSRLMWAASIPLLAWAFSVLFLLWPPQTVDLLSSATWLQTIAYHLAVTVWSVSCWYWARWCLNLEPVTYPETLCDTVPEPGANWADLREAGAKWANLHSIGANLANLRHRGSGTEGEREELPQRPPVVTLVAPILVDNTRSIAQPGRFLRNWIARFPLLASPFVGIIPLYRGGENRGLQFLVLALVELPIVLIVANREWLAHKSPRVRRHFAQDRTDDGKHQSQGGLLTRKQCFAHLPFGPFSWLFWIVPFAIICLLLLWNQVDLPRLLGAPAISLLGLAAATGVVTISSVLVRRCLGLPGLLVFLAYASLIAAFSDNHQIRTIDEKGDRAAVVLNHVDNAISGRRMLPVLLDQWAAACGRDSAQPMIVLVATAGGASRAALWTASVMHQAEQAVGAVPFRQALFSLSGVSGGSLGAAAYVAALPPDYCDVAAKGTTNTVRPAAETDREAAVEKNRWERLEAALSANFLAPPIAAYMTTDLAARIIPPIFLPSSYPDRAAALEKAWEQAFNRAWDGDAGSEVPPHAGSLDRAFMALWGGSPPGQRLPLLLLNGTHANSGLPILTAPVQVTRDQFPLALDLLDLTGRDLHVSTAVSNSARFPVVTPGGTLTSRYPASCKIADKPCDPVGPNYGGYVMDGGYVENFGADTTRDIVADIDAWRDSRRASGLTDFVPHVLVIQISSDPAANLAEIPRCGPLVNKPLGLNAVDRPAQALADLLGPLVTVVDARGARGARTAGDLMRRKCPEAAGAGYIEYVHFALCNQTIGDRKADDVIGLNWALTPVATAFLGGGAPKNTEIDDNAASQTENGVAGATAMQSCGNQSQLRHLVAWFAKPWKPPPQSPKTGTDQSTPGR